jgi:two-component system nitrogen regulation sensor histidine kinase NtrY
MELPEEPIVAMFDGRLISQVLTNLIKNAVEAIEGAGIEAIKDPRIVVDAHIEGEMVRLTISDNGKGWPKENRNRLLEPYVTTREKGTGLGLAIVAKIIEQHGGKVDLVDAEPDENGRTGAAFTFTLPLRRADEEEGDADPSPTMAEGDQQSAPVAADGAAGGAEPVVDNKGEPQLQAAENS